MELIGNCFSVEQVVEIINKTFSLDMKFTREKLLTHAQAGLVSFFINGRGILVSPELNKNLKEIWCKPLKKNIYLKKNNSLVLEDEVVFGGRVTFSYSTVWGKPSDGYHIEGYYQDDETKTKYYGYDNADIRSERITKRLNLWSKENNAGIRFWFDNVTQSTSVSDEFQPWDKEKLLLVECDFSGREFSYDDAFIPRFLLEEYIAKLKNKYGVQQRWLEKKGTEKASIVNDVGKKKGVFDRRLDTLKKWLKSQNNFDPHGHDMTKAQVWSELEKINNNDFSFHGIVNGQLAATPKGFFNKVPNGIISFKSGARKIL